MTAPTSEERREIARRLRAAAKTKSNSADYLWKRLEIAVNGWKFGDVIDESYVFDNDVLARLADLIDPTCHNQHPRASDGCFCCSECLFLYEPTDWSACRNGFLYCPRCGARVVRGGED